MTPEEDIKFKIDYTEDEQCINCEHFEYNGANDKCAAFDFIVEPYYGRCKFFIRWRPNTK